MPAKGMLVDDKGEPQAYSRGGTGCADEGRTARADAALDYAERLARVAPGDRSVADLVQELRGRVKKPVAQ
jgi:hypothetical protein